MEEIRPLSQQPPPTLEASAFRPGATAEYCPLVNEAIMRYADQYRSPHAAKVFSNTMLTLFFNTLANRKKFEHFVYASDHAQIAIQTAPPQYRIDLTPELLLTNFQRLSEKRKLAEQSIDPEVLLNLCELAQSDHFLSELAHNTLVILLFDSKFEHSLIHFENLVIIMTEAALSDDLEHAELTFNVLTGNFISKTEVAPAVTNFYRNLIQGYWRIHNYDRINQIAHWIDLAIHEVSLLLPEVAIVNYNHIVQQLGLETLETQTSLPQERLGPYIFKIIHVFIQDNELITRLQKEAAEYRSQGRSDDEICITTARKLLSIQSASFASRVEKAIEMSLNEIGSYIVDDKVPLLRDLARAKNISWIRLSGRIPVLAERLHFQRINTGKESYIALYAGGMFIPLRVRTDDGIPIPGDELGFAIKQYHAMIAMRKVYQVPYKIAKREELRDLFTYFVAQARIIPWYDRDLSTVEEQPDLSAEIHRIINRVRTDFKYSVSPNGDMLSVPEQSPIYQLLGFRHITYRVVNPRIATGVIAIELQIEEARVPLLIDSNLNIFFQGSLTVSQALQSANNITSILEAYPAYWYTYLILGGLGLITSGQLVKKVSSKSTHPSQMDTVTRAFKGRRGLIRHLPRGCHFTDEQYKIALEHGVNLVAVNDLKETAGFPAWDTRIIQTPDGEREVRLGRFTFVTPAFPGSQTETEPNVWNIVQE